MSHQIADSSDNSSKPRYGLYSSVKLDCTKSRNSTCFALDMNPFTRCAFCDLPPPSPPAPPRPVLRFPFRQTCLRHVPLVPPLAFLFVPWEIIKPREILRRSELTRLCTISGRRRPRSATDGRQPYCGKKITNKGNKKKAA